MYATVPTRYKYIGIIYGQKGKGWGDRPADACNPEESETIDKDGVDV